MRACTATPRASASTPHAVRSRAAKSLQLPRSTEVSRWCAGALGAALLLCSDPASAASSSKVGEFTASGLLFKDTIEVASIEDPDIEGATIYVTEYKRSLTDRLANDPFSDPAQASVTCAATGPVRVKDAAKLRSQKDGSEVFEERKGINIIQNKRLRVRRLYDADHDTLIYISYSTAITKESSAGENTASRYRTSLCVLPLSPGTVGGAPEAGPGGS